MKKELTIFFTGGMDSTITAILCSKEFKKIHLITFDNGLMFFLNLAEERARELKLKIFHTTIVHKIIPTKNIFKELKKGISKDFLRFKSPFVLDICDQLAMHASAIIYNHKNGIKATAHGANLEQSKWTKQNTRYIKEINNFYNKYGQKLITPSYDFGSRINRWEYLKDMGFILGPKFLSNWAFLLVSKQPFCITELYGSPLGRLRLDLNINDSINYIKEKFHIANQIISRYI